MTLIMLRRSAHGPFRRSVRDERGNILYTLEFQPGAPLDLAGADLDAVAGDIGHALVEVGLDEKSRPRPLHPEPLPAADDVDDDDLDEDEDELIPSGHAFGDELDDEDSDIDPDADTELEPADVDEEYTEHDPTLPPALDEQPVARRGRPRRRCARCQRRHKRRPGRRARSRRRGGPRRRWRRIGRRRRQAEARSPQVGGLLPARL